MPTPAINIRTPIAQIVLGLITGLRQLVPFPGNLIKLWRADADLPPLADGDRDIVVQVGQPVPDQFHVINAGRVDTRLKRIITVTLRTRFEADEASQALGRLLDPAFGHLPFEDAVINAVQLLDLLTTQPARIVPGTPPRSVAKSPNWTASTVGVEAVYIASLDQSRQ